MKILTTRMRKTETHEELKEHHYLHSNHVPGEHYIVQKHTN
jgi:hypothetical protein